MNIYLCFKFPESVFVDYMSITSYVCYCCVLSYMGVNVYENTVLLVTCDFSGVIQLFSIIIPVK